jgi:hypothetical protein
VICIKPTTSQARGDRALRHAARLTWRKARAQRRRYLAGHPIRRTRMRHRLLSVLPLLALVAAGCAAPGMPRSHAGAERCPQEAAAPHGAASGSMATSAMHREMHARMHPGAASSPAGAAEHQHDAAAPASCPRRP